MIPIVVASNYVSLPEAGGLNNQDPLFLDDLNMWLRLEKIADREVEEEKGMNIVRGNFGAA